MPSSASGAAPIATTCPSETSHRWRGTGRALLDALIVVTLEPACASCAARLETPTSGPVCEACWKAVPRLVPPVCQRCGLPIPTSPSRADGGTSCPQCRLGPHHVAVLRSLGPYDGCLRDIVHAIKYRGHRSVASRLAALLREVAPDALAGADAVVPVPLHWSRLWRRGFNQAAELARGLGPPVIDGLVRVRATTSQATLPSAKRRANVSGAFAVRRRAVRLALRGAMVVLVDDVCTTGATLDACARVLLDAGVREVRAITAARAVPARP